MMFVYFFCCRFVNSFGSITRLRIEFERLKSHLIKTESPIVFAHNDLLLGNVIYNQDEGTIAFIDYEYATYNYQGFDIANHFNEFVGEWLPSSINCYLLINYEHVRRLTRQVSCNETLIIVRVIWHPEQIPTVTGQSGTYIICLPYQK